ncbi:hypothetical protein ASPZODRAFT_12503 [Penicilliopsis zonata CBS 506.65]|uniref:Basic proline-rich protein n=1 Tax=Penicilliopsis zonata CBS 506.65 TaxID=1073090 RepID=A0A1L9SWY4_9EURO|nr:hypothetical protein ASPZODRAFT_12503 [Penicilliopsis zonata CBS 506.65]OJJ51690.1 hypothetical protein ASPZODRAFT_12503 [Penicilliopsis zonata CBS 506.65]
MEEPRLLPEQIMLPPSPAESVESVEATTEEEGSTRTETADATEDVMITLSLPTQLASRPVRNHSPFSRSHFRSRSLAELPAPMTRAYSSPGPDSRGRYIFVKGHGVPMGLLDNPASAERDALEEETPVDARMSSLNLNISPTISEHVELDMSAHPSTSHSTDLPTTTSPVLAPHIFPRISRRRPSSPLHLNSSASSVSQSISSTPSPSHYPPTMVLGSKYNETYPSYSASSASSIPSTPTSLRSRSPSISSLETIPDIPDAEAAAIEDDRLAALQAAADKVDESDAAGSTVRRRGTSDVPNPSGTLSNTRPGLGGYGVRTDKRKRWSVCGAERRGDLDLETIWED